MIRRGIYKYAWSKIRRRNHKTEKKREEKRIDRSERREVSEKKGEAPKECLEKRDIKRRRKRWILLQKRRN